MPYGVSEADSTSRMFSKASANGPRGRRPVFSEDALRMASRYSYARRVRSRRGAQDLVYRQFAITAIELYSEAFPEKAAPLEWLLEPTPRHSLLTELGRIAKPRSGEGEALEWNAPDVSKLIRTAFVLAGRRPTTKAGVALIREIRRGDDAEGSMPEATEAPAYATGASGRDE